MDLFDASALATGQLLDGKTLEDLFRASKAGAAAAEVVAALSAPKVRRRFNPPA